MTVRLLLVKMAEDAMVRWSDTDGHVMSCHAGAYLAGTRGVGAWPESQKLARSVASNRRMKEA